MSIKAQFNLRSDGDTSGRGRQRALSTLFISALTLFVAPADVLASSPRSANAQTAPAIRIVPGLAEPLLAMGATTSVEAVDLDAAIDAFRRAPSSADFPERAESFNAFLIRHPESAWRISILVDLGSGYYRAGYFSKAFDAWQSAWDLGRNRVEPREKAIVDRAFGELVRMHARVGHAPQLEALFQDAGARPISGPATEMVTGAHEGLWMFQNDWGVAYLCGPMALKNLLGELGAPKEKIKVVEAARSGPHGFTFAQVAALASSVGLDHALIYRAPGDAIPVPSIVNWKINHYAAVVEEANGRYRIKDPTFADGDLWMTRAAINEESSGFFLVPTTTERDASWRAATANEAAEVYGMGYTSQNQPGANGPPDQNSHPPGPCGDMPGMCVANAKSMVVSVNLSDRPLGYRAPKGPSPDFSIVYNQREAYQPAVFGFFNVSPKWTLGALSYIQDDPNSPGNSVVRYMPGGGAIDYANGYSFNASTGAFSPERQNRATLVRNPASGPLVSYVLNMPDGSKHVFGRSDGAASAPRRMFLTQMIDTAGNTLNYSYDSSLRLLSMTDATGRSTTFNYTSSFSPLLVTQIVDPMGRHADLTYDGQGRLASITDVIGLTSAFSYDAGGLVNVMTTPYGTSTFVYGQDTSVNSRYLEATDAMGYTERVEFRHSAPGIPFNDPVVPAGWQNIYLNYRNTYYWDKHTYPISHTDYASAQITHWLHNPLGQTSPAIESTKMPLERRVWRSYPNQGGNTLQEFTVDTPLSIARVLDDGSTQANLFSYNALGNVLSAIDPAGRRTVYAYAANGIDVTGVQQQTDSSGTLSTISAFTYNGQHRPLTYTDAAGQTTSITYNSAGQPTSVTNALGQTTSYGYDSYGRVTSTVNANGIVQKTWTYDAFDHVATTTDSEGYTLSYTYDDLDRLTQIAYPDGTTMQYGYNRLDRVSVKDRQNRVTSYTFDADRRMTSIRDPLAQITSFGYFENGTLASVTDPKGNTTQWGIDLQSRPTAKRYANGATETYSYEASTSRLRSITDALGQTKNYGYTVDDRPAAIAYASPQRPTPSVSFVYDAFFPRAVSMTDGIGQTTWQYQPTGVPGALQVAVEKGPYNNDALTYQYDALGRVVGNAGTGETFGYDPLGRLVTHNNSLGAFALGYLGQTDQMTSRLRSNGMGTQWSYQNNAGDRRLAGIANSGLSRSFSISTSPTNTIYLIDEFVGSSHNFIKSSYDATDRLTFVNSSNGLLYNYGYDGASNLTNLNGLTASYDAANQLTNLGGTAYVYDANGNVIDDGSRTYSWDAEDRLTGVAYKQLPKSATYRYDGLGRRLSIKDYQGVGTRYLWCGDRICQSRTSADALKTRYFIEGVVPSGTAGFVYGVDQLGTVRDQTSLSPVGVGSFDYDPYGKLTAQSGTPASEFGYAGLFYDVNSGLYLANYRAYDPSSARWVSKDPLREIAGLNLYGYVGGNPKSRIDPTGLLNVVLGGGGSGVIGVGPEGSLGVFITLPSKGINFDIGVYASGGIGAGINVGVAGQGGIIKGDVNDIRGITGNINFSGSPISSTAMFDSNGHLVGGTIGPAAEVGASISYSRSGAASLGELGRVLGGWLYDRLHPNQCY